MEGINLCGESKPRVSLVGQDGNVYNLLAICTNALKRSNQQDKAQELQKRVLGCGSYDEALRIMLEYVDEGFDEDDEDDEDEDEE